MPEETETGKQIKGALGGIAEGLAAAFAPKKAPPKRERPAIQVLGVLSDEDIQQAEQRNPGSTTKGKRPTIKMNPTKSGRTQKKQQAERDAAWQQSAATMPAGLPEEKRYVKEGTEGQPGVVEVTGATAHEYGHQVQDIRDASPGGFIEGVAKLPDAPSLRSRGSRVHFDAGHT